MRTKCNRIDCRENQFCHTLYVLPCYGRGPTGEEELGLPRLQLQVVVVVVSRPYNAALYGLLVIFVVDEIDFVVVVTFVGPFLCQVATAQTADQWAQGEEAK